MLRNFLVNTLLVLFSALLSIVIFEYALRVYYFGSLAEPKKSKPGEYRTPHRTRGWALKPFYSGHLNTLDYSVILRTNAEGFRDVEHSLVADDGVFRVVVLGDSFMEAYQVPLQQSFSRQLEKRLAEYSTEVINLGVGGYGTTQQYLTLEEIGLAYKPDLVVLAFFGNNDVRNNHPELERLLWGKDTLKTYGRPFAKIEADNTIEMQLPDWERVSKWVASRDQAAKKRAEQSKVLENTLLHHLITRVFETRAVKDPSLPKYNANVWLGAQLTTFNPSLSSVALSEEDYTQIWNEGWKVSERLITEIADLTRNNDSEFLLITVPAKIEIEENFRSMIGELYTGLVFDTRQTGRRLSRLSAETGIRFLDLQPEFLQAYQATGQPLFHHLSDRHWNIEGHRLAAEKTAGYIFSEILGRSK